MAQDPVNARPWYAKVPFVSASAPLPRVSLDGIQPPMTPEVTATWLSLITFGWLDDLLSLGYARPLEKSDLYRLPSSRDSAKYAKGIETAFQRRKVDADKINAKIANRELKPPLRLRLIWALTGDSTKQYEAWITNHPRAEPSLVLALNDAIFWWLWIGGALKLLADVGTVCVPLLIRVSIEFPPYLLTLISLVKALTNFVTESYEKRGQPDAPSTRRGVGLALGLFLIQLASVVLNVHGFYRGFTTGLILRGALINALFSRSLRLTNQARARGGFTTGKLVGMISTDVSRVDFCMGYFHISWTAPIQMLICLALLIYNLGYSAIPGFAFCVLMTPVQGRITKVLFGLRYDLLFRVGDLSLRGYAKQKTQHGMDREADKDPARDLGRHASYQIFCVGGRLSVSHRASLD